MSCVTSTQDFDNSLIILGFKYSSLKRFYLFILDTGGRKEKERDRNINVWLPPTCPLLETCSTTQSCALSGNQTGDPLVDRPALNPLSHSSHGLCLKILKQKKLVIYS